MCRASPALQQASSIYSGESFANGSSSVYFDQMYEQWKQDPESVHSSFRAYFQNVEGEKDFAYQAPPTLGQDGTQNTSQIVNEVLSRLGGEGARAGASSAALGSAHQHVEVMDLIRAF